jgi:hypothetical protein
LEEVVRHMATLNRNMGVVLSLRNDVGNVAEVWTRFHDVMRKTSDVLETQLATPADMAAPDIRGSS